MAKIFAEKITSRTNPLIVRMAKLSEKKHRDAEGLFRIDGVKLFAEAVKSGVKVEYIFISEKKLDSLKISLQGELEAASATIITVTDEVLSKLTEESAPQGIVAVCEKFQASSCDMPEGDFRAVYLSSIRDPGNLGTIIRTAYAFGASRVFMSADCADIYSPKVLRAAMGTIFRQPLSVVTDETMFADTLKASECALYGAALRRDSAKLGEFPMPERVCFAIGNEGHGLSDNFIDACTGTVFIPMNEGCESLNAASAANVIIWEMCRTRLCESAPY